MRIDNKYFPYLVWGLVLGLLLSTEAVAKTEFYLLPNDVLRKTDCDYLEIKNNQILCTSNHLLITYDLSRIKKIEAVHNSKSFHVQKFTQEAIKRINDLNSKKIANKQTKPASQKYGFTQQLSFDSFSDFAQSVKNSYEHRVGNSTLATILFVSGLVVFLIGSFGFLVATFRAGFLWGLSCFFLPFVSFIFLFVHWKIAAKPFFLSMLGIAIALLGTMFVTASGTGQSISKYSSKTSLYKGKMVKGNFKCIGKIYCSEMKSCSEAQFYLSNCPGTKIDGDNDGIPCENQWCGQ